MVPVLSKELELHTASPAVVARFILLHNAGVGHGGCRTHSDNKRIVSARRQMQRSDVLKPDNHAHRKHWDGLGRAAVEGEGRRASRWSLVKEDDAVIREDWYDFAPLPLLPGGRRGSIGRQGDLRAVFAEDNGFSPAHLQKRLHGLPLLGQRGT